MPRVGIIGLIHESNSFVPEPTPLALFHQSRLLTGTEILARYGSEHHEVGGFLAGAESYGLTPVPLVGTSAIPSGPVTDDACRYLVDLVLSQIEAAGPLDGLLVAPHGAMVSESIRDFDGHWLSLVRDAVGPDMPIIGTLDPHGNLSQKMIDATDALIAYKTNPHLDQRQRGIEAAKLMSRTLAGEIRPVHSAAFPPMIINIERQCTEESPCRDFLSKFAAAERQPGLLSTSLMLGFPYSDVEEMGTAVIAVADGDTNAARRVANQLATLVWDAREQCVGTMISVADAATKAASISGPVLLLDMGDNVGGGSPADGTWIAHELHNRRIGPSLVILNDPSVVAEAALVGVGNTTSFTVGGKVDTQHGPPLTANFRVAGLYDGVFTETEARHGGAGTFHQGATAILTADSGLTVMATSRRTPPFSLRQVTTFGLKPESFQAIVAKGVNAPIAAYKPVCPNIIRVNTPGCTSADLSTFTYQHRRRPMFPFERDARWSI